jgi:hypothetical protein
MQDESQDPIQAEAKFIRSAPVRGRIRQRNRSGSGEASGGGGYGDADTARIR